MCTDFGQKTEQQKLRIMILDCECWLILFLVLTLDCNNLENGNLFTEVPIINDYKNDPKKSSRFIFHYYFNWLDSAAKKTCHHRKLHFRIK